MLKGRIFRYSSLVLLLIISRATVYGQGLCFESNVTRGCVPLVIEITKCSSGISPKYDYGDSTVYNFIDPQGRPYTELRTPSNTHTYYKPGIYVINQVAIIDATNGSLNSNDPANSKPFVIEVLPLPTPTFEIKSCAGKQVSVHITDTAYDLYRIDFDDGTIVNAAKGQTEQHIYDDNTVRTIKVTGFHKAQKINLASSTATDVGSPCPGPESKLTVTPINTVPIPKIQLLAVKDGANIEMTFEAEPFITYQLEQQNGGSYQPIATLSNPAMSPAILSHTIANVNTTNSYTFRVVAIDGCGNQKPSEEISSIVLTSSTTNDQIDLAWQMNAMPAFQGYTLSREGQPVATVLSSGQSTYSDQTVQCPNTYCYQMEATLASGAKSVSASICARAVSQTSPGAVENLLASITDGFPELTWTVPAGVTGREFVVSQAESGGAFIEIGKTSESRYSDKTAKTNQKNYCYKIIYSDACGNTSAPSAEVCPILLTKVASQRPYDIQWTNYRGWTGGLQAFVVERLDESGTVYESQPVGQALTYSDDEPDFSRQLVRFRIKASETGTGRSSFSNVLEIRQAYRLFVPDAFTPNNDGLNDVFEVEGLYLQNAEMTIFDRWGSVIFHSYTKEEGWDGRINGREAPAGSYVCKLEVEDFLGNHYTQTRNFVLLR
jgi:gliding motility-associated-like protein